MTLMDPWWHWWTLHTPKRSLGSLWTLHDSHWPFLYLYKILEPNQTFIDPSWSSFTLITLTGSSWTRHDLHGNTMTFIDPSIISRPSNVPTFLDLMDPPMSSWILHDPNGPNMTLMDPAWPPWKHHDTYRTFLNLQTLHEPNQSLIETYLELMDRLRSSSWWTLNDPHGPSMIPMNLTWPARTLNDHNKPSLTLPYINLIDLIGNKGLWRSEWRSDVVT